MNLLSLLISSVLLTSCFSLKNIDRDEPYLIEKSKSLAPFWFKLNGELKVNNKNFFVISALQQKGDLAVLIKDHLNNTPEGVDFIQQRLNLPPTTEFQNAYYLQDIYYEKFRNVTPGEKDWYHYDISFLLVKHQ